MRLSSLGTISIALPLLFFATLPFAHGLHEAKRVLVIHSYHAGYSFTMEEHRGIEEGLQKEKLKVELFTHFLDAKRFDINIRFREIARYLSSLYKTYTFDLVIATDNDALNFVVQYRSTLFPKTPIVFCGINDYSPDLLRGEQGITGVAEVVALKETIDLARSLFPDRDHLVFLIDNTSTGTALRREIARVQKSYPFSLTFIYLRLGLLSFSEIKELLRKYQGKSIVFPLQLNQDRDGRVYDVAEALEEVRRTTQDPLFTVTDPHYRLGVIGGKITLPYYQGLAAGNMAARILKGEDPATIPVQTETYSPYIFDYRYLEAYHIPLKSLPEGSQIIHRPPSIWERYSETIPYILILLVAETVTILLLIDALRRNKQFQTMLQRLVKEKEMLIREVNHRVKNNLSTVKSLLSIQKSSSSDPSVLEALGEAENRIHSISLTHRLLYGSLNSKTIDLRTYLEELISGIRDSFQTEKRGVTIQLEVPQVQMEADIIRNIGLIVNEAVTKALKHAFNGGGGNIRIQVFQLQRGTQQQKERKNTALVPRNTPSQWVLIIEDDGKGIPEDKPKSSDSLGFTIMESLSETLKGVLTIDRVHPGTNRPGTRITVEFPRS
ncbi:MAG: ATP-binding protein [Spirochaetes bacterium]|nr:ATP-binding protein [Spirochaetota bacterium]